MNNENWHTCGIHQKELSLQYQKGLRGLHVEGGYLLRRLIRILPPGKVAWNGLSGPYMVGRSKGLRSLKGLKVVKDILESGVSVPVLSKFSRSYEVERCREH